MRIVILGLSITSSWGNGHATTYRGLVRELVARGHEVLFLERDKPWYAEHHDLDRTRAYGEVQLYGSVAELQARHGREIRRADCVIVGSYVPEGVAVGEWVTACADGLTAFYDIDTPVTLAQLAAGTCDYLAEALIARYGLYLSFTGGPTLERIGREYGVRVSPLYCSADPSLYYPDPQPAKKWALGYLGTYSEDRQPALERLLLDPARQLPAAKLVVAGPLYPETIRWPANVARVAHLGPAEHRAFYNAQTFTLNITRADMVRAGYSPSVRLFEAAACGTPIITDPWEGLSEFFAAGEEILVANSAPEVIGILRDLPQCTAREIGERARQRVLGAHTAAHRAAELENLIVRYSSSSDHTHPRDPTLETATLA